MSNTERELRTIELPSGIKANIVTYFVRGEIRSINKARWTGTEISTSDDNKALAGKIDPNTQEYMDDELVFQGTKSILQGETENQISRELIENMRSEDFDAILKEVTKLFLGGKGN